MEFEMTHKLAVATLGGSYPSVMLAGFFVGLGLGYVDEWEEFHWYPGLHNICDRFTIEELLCFAQMCIDSNFERDRR